MQRARRDSNLNGFGTNAEKATVVGQPGLAALLYLISDSDALDNYRGVSWDSESFQCSKSFLKSRQNT